MKPEDYRFSANWDLQRECRKYLEIDVRATAELALTIFDLLYNLLHVNPSEFITLSHLSYQVWCASVAPNINKRTQDAFPFSRIPNPNDEKIYKPDMDLHIKSVNSAIGGTCYPTKKKYESNLYEKIKIFIEKYKKNEPMTEDELLDFDEIEDYATLLDIVSMYPAVMANNPYPIGPVRNATDDEIKEMNDGAPFLFGIYRATVVPPRNLVVPVLPTKSVSFDYYGRYHSNGLEHDLNERTSDYTNIDLDNARRRGYEVEIHDGKVWDKCAYIFKEFIEMCFKMKAEADVKGNQAMRRVAKILMNSLFGKFLQKPHEDMIAIVTTTSEAEKFLKNYIVTDIVNLDMKETSGIVFNQENENPSPYIAIFKGIRALDNKTLAKPSYIGSFILSYSRQLYHRYIDELDPYRYLNPFLSIKYSPAYTDTDSFLMIVDKEMKERITPLLGDKLGQIADELKGGKIIRFFALGPKTYYYEYVNYVKTFGPMKSQQEYDLKQYPRIWIHKEVMKCKGNFPFLQKIKKLFLKEFKKFLF